MTNVPNLSAGNPTLVGQEVRAAHGSPFDHQMMFLMENAVGVDLKLLPRLFWEPEFVVQSACNQPLVELPDRLDPVRGVRDDLQGTARTTFRPAVCV